MSLPPHHRTKAATDAAASVLCAAAVVCTLTGCAKEDSFEAESFVESLITRPDRRVVTRVPEGKEIKPGSITPVSGKNSHAGMRSSLLMPPGSEVTFKIPEDVGQATYLRFATGVDNTSYTGGEGAEDRFI